MDELRLHIEKIIKEIKERKRMGFDDPMRKASMHGYIEAMEEILEYIEDNEE